MGDASPARGDDFSTWFIDQFSVYWQVRRWGPHRRTYCGLSVDQPSRQGSAPKSWRRHSEQVADRCPPTFVG